jgi:hypothetical protein
MNADRFKYKEITNIGMHSHAGAWKREKQQKEQKE